MASACCEKYGNPFVQTLFMGASVVQFSATVGWNNSDGGMDVELVEDKCAGHPRIYANGAASLGVTTDADNFSPPTVGSPVFFYYGGFTMGGILQSWQQNDSADGAKTYSVKITSPNNILNGVPVILEAYDGQTMGVPNLLNVHGVIESSCNGCGETGFNSTYPVWHDRADGSEGMAEQLFYQPAPGWCERPATGWRWSQIRAALISLLSTPGAVTFRGYSYIVDITDLPVLNDDIRIVEPNKTLLELIQHVCNIAGVEYFLDVIPLGQAGSCVGNLGLGPHIIKVRVGKSCIQALDQSAADIDLAICTDIEDRLSLGTISQNINGDLLNGCVRRKQLGLELAVNVFNAFITGDYRCDLWQIDQSNPMACDYTDNIWPYWGRDQDAAPPGVGWGGYYLGENGLSPYATIDGKDGCSYSVETWDHTKSHHFQLNVRFLNIPGLPDGYWDVTVPEMRAALMGESNWRNYLFNLEPNKFKLLFKGAFAENDVVKMIADLDNAKADARRAKIVQSVIDGNLGPDDPKLKGGIDVQNLWNQNVARVLANPDESETGTDDQNCLTWKPDQQTFNMGQAWITTSKLFDFIHRYASEYYGRQFMVKLPFICTSFSEDAPWTWGLNWMTAAAGWSDGAVLGIDPNDQTRGWVLSQFRTDDGRLRGFCKFVAPRTMILDKISNKDDVAVISENEVYVSCTVTEIIGITPTDWRAVIVLAGPVGIMPCLGIASELQLIHALFDVNIQRQGTPDGITEEQWATLLANAGGDKSAIGGFTAYLWPDACSVPLQSKKLVYGPWYAQNGGIFGGATDGITQYERRTEMTPWSYGSMSLLNTAGYLIANAYVHDKYVVEQGEVEFPGAPVGNLGQILFAGGPVVNRINVTFGRGDGAVMTTISMRTWTPYFGQLGMARAAAIHRATEIAMKNQAIFRKWTLDNNNRNFLASTAGDHMVNIQRTMSVVGLMGTSSHECFFGNAFADPVDSDWACASVVSSEPRKDLAMFRARTYNSNDDYTDDFTWEPTPDTDADESGGSDDNSANTDPGAPNDSQHVPYTMTATQAPDNCTDDGAHWRRRAYMEQIGLLRPFSTIFQDAADCNDDGKYLSRYERLNGATAVPTGPDPQILNTDSGQTSETKGCDFTKCNSYFYSNEQVPPIYCYEDNVPITVNTLNPFLSDEFMMKPDKFTDLCGKQWGGWTSDDTLSLTPGAGSYEVDGQTIKVGHDIEYIARDGLYPTHLSVREDDYSPVSWYRAIALRGPLVIAGWGYDIDNHPVPNSAENYDNWDGRSTPGVCSNSETNTDPQWNNNQGPTRKFADGFLRKPHTWKCGPVDLRWDYRRKVWTAPPAMKICKAVLCQWLLPNQCAGAVIYDDMMQWDNDGKSIKTETCCGKTGYKVTVWSNSLRPLPKGWQITVWYDTTKQRYELLSHDELPLLEAVLNDKLSCSGCVSATVVGIAGTSCGCGSIPCTGNCGSGGTKSCNCTQLDPCSAFVGMTILLSNPLCQPICSGRRVFVWVCEAETSDNNTSDQNPTLGDCTHQCKDVSCLRGVILQAQFHPECVVASVDLIENTIYYHLDDAVDITWDYTPSGSVVGSGHLYGTATGLIPVPTGELATQPSTSQNPRMKAQGNFTAAVGGTITTTGNVCVTPSGTVNLGSVDASGSVSVPITVSGGTYGLSINSFTPGGTISNSLGLSCTSTTAGVTVYQEGTADGTVDNFTPAGTINNTLAINCSSTDITVTGDGSTLSLTTIDLHGTATGATDYFTPEGTIDFSGLNITCDDGGSSSGDCSGSSCCCSCQISEDSAITFDGTSMSVNVTVYDFSSVIGTVSGPFTMSSTGSFTCPTLTGGVSFTGDEITGLGLTVDGIVATGNVTITPSCSVTGAITFTGNSITPTGTVTIPNVNATGSGTVNVGLTGNGTFTGTPTCVQVVSTGTIPTTSFTGVVCLPIYGTVDIPKLDIAGCLPVNDLFTDADLSEAGFIFRGSKCTFDVDITFHAIVEEYQYDVCVCTRQIFIESEMGITTCAAGGTPCTCPTECLPAAICSPYIEWGVPCVYCPTVTVPGPTGYFGDNDFLDGSGSLTGCTPVPAVTPMSPPLYYVTCTPQAGAASTGTPTSC